LPIFWCHSERREKLRETGARKALWKDGVGGKRKKKPPPDKFFRPRLCEFLKQKKLLKRTGRKNGERGGGTFLPYKDSPNPMAIRKLFKRRRNL